MVYIKQLGIIFFICLLGEVIRGVLPNVPITSSVYGVIILFVCLLTKIIKIEDIAGAGKYLLGIMPILFVPSATGLIKAGDELIQILFPVIAISILSTIFVIVTVGHVSQLVVRLGKDKKDDK